MLQDLRGASVWIIANRTDLDRIARRSASARMMEPVIPQMDPVSAWTVGRERTVRRDRALMESMVQSVIKSASVTMRTRNCKTINLDSN